MDNDQSDEALRQTQEQAERDFVTAREQLAAQDEQQRQWSSEEARQAAVEASKAQQMKAAPEPEHTTEPEIIARLQPVPQQREALTLEDIERDPWNAVNLEIPKTADRELLQKVLETSDRLRDELRSRYGDELDDNDKARGEYLATWDQYREANFLIGRMQAGGDDGAEKARAAYVAASGAERDDIARNYIKSGMEGLVIDKELAADLGKEIGVPYGDAKSIFFEVDSPLAGEEYKGLTLKEAMQKRNEEIYHVSQDDGAPMPSGGAVPQEPVPDHDPDGPGKGPKGGQTVPQPAVEQTGEQHGRVDTVWMEPSAELTEADRRDMAEAFRPVPGPGNDNQHEQQPEPLTLEAIERDPWNAVNMPLPDNADCQLLDVVSGTAFHLADTAEASPEDLERAEERGRAAVYKHDELACYDQQAVAGKEPSPLGAEAPTMHERREHDIGDRIAALETLLGSQEGDRHQAYAAEQADYGDRIAAADDPALRGFLMSGKLAHSQDYAAELCDEAGIKQGLEGRFEEAAGLIYEATTHREIANGLRMDQPEHTAPERVAERIDMAQAMKATAAEAFGWEAPAVAETAGQSIDPQAVERPYPHDIKGRPGLGDYAILRAMMPAPEIAPVADGTGREGGDDGVNFFEDAPTRPANHWTIAPGIGPDGMFTKQQPMNGTRAEAEIVATAEDIKADLREAAWEASEKAKHDNESWGNAVDPFAAMMATVERNREAAARAAPEEAENTHDAGHSMGGMGR